jgi:ectoine hydroxylase-related dioxygenase (phytanoyl-CoA dioxygenase family)
MVEAGYLIEQNVLTPGECDDLIATLSRIGRTRGRGGARHLMSIPEIAALGSDLRLIHIASEALGRRAIPYRATLFDKSGRANWFVVWHQDTALPLKSRIASNEWGPWSSKGGVLYAHAPTWALNRIVALRVHLDSSTSENGPLRVIPGSHRAGVVADERAFCTTWGKEAVECLVPRGGILSMRPLLIHSSSKSLRDHPRRVVHIEYADALELRPGIKLVVA